MQQARQEVGHELDATTPVLSRDGTVAVASVDGSLVAVDTRTGELRTAEVRGTDARVAVSPDGSLAAVATGPRVDVVDLTSGVLRLARRCALPLDVPSLVAVADDGAVLVSSASEQAVVRVVDDGTATEAPLPAGLHAWLLPWPVERAGTHAVLGVVDEGTTALVARFDRRSPVVVDHGDDLIGAARVGTLAATYDAADVRLWRAGGEEGVALVGRQRVEGVAALAASPDGSRLLTVAVRPEPDEAVPTLVLEEISLVSGARQVRARERLDPRTSVAIDDDGVVTLAWPGRGGREPVRFRRLRSGGTRPA